MRRLILPFLLLFTILAVFFWGAHTNLQLNAANAASNLPINLKAQNKDLVILVDRIDLDQPQLRNVWLVLSKSPGSTLTFLPIYLNSSSNQQPVDQQLNDMFSLTENGAPADIFMNELKNKGISWKHYIVIDDVLIAKGIDLSGGIKIDDREIPASDVLSGNFYSEQASRETEVIQSLLISNLCQRMPIISLHPDYEDFLLTVLSHSRSSFSFDEIIVNLRTISQNEVNLECQFPTIPDISDE
jgi:hypothetical protein